MFYQDADGPIARALYNGQYFNSVRRYDVGLSNTKLSAAYLPARDGALVLYQAEEHPTLISFKLIASDGTESANGSVSCGRSC